MSLTLSLCGNTSTITTSYFPTIDLDGQFECGLIDFITYNSIPNIDKTNNLFHFGKRTIEIPTGSYEIDDINEYLNEVLKTNITKDRLSIKANNNTLSTEISGSERIDFTKERTIGSLLGFNKRILPMDVISYSDNPVNILKVNSIRIECSIVSGSFYNNKPTHTIYEFSPDVPPGYKINERSNNIIYLPVNVRQISTITIRIIDQNGDSINFRGETINIRLHLRKIQKYDNIP